MLSSDFPKYVYGCVYTQSVNILACCQGATQRFFCPPGSFEDFVYLQVIYNTDLRQRVQERVWSYSESADSLENDRICYNIFCSRDGNGSPVGVGVTVCDKSFPQINNLSKKRLDSTTFIPRKQSHNTFCTRPLNANQSRTATWKYWSLVS